MFGQVKMVMGVDAFDTAVMDSSTAAPGAKLGGLMASVMEIEGGAGVVIMVFVLEEKGKLRRRDSSNPMVML
jgi:hypothetical protein